MTELKISQQAFKEKLNTRIDLGKELLSRQIRTYPELDELEDDFCKWHDYNRELLKQSFNEPNNEYRKEYEQFGIWEGIIPTGERMEDPIEKLKKKIKNKVHALEKLDLKADLIQSKEKSRTNVENNSLDMEKVFIVHGHDDLLKTEVARFISDLGFKPIILHEQASSGQTIIEKIESNSDVGFGVVLYTPCDIGAKKTKSPNLQDRARQNVVFEHGFLIGKIGRKRVAAIVKGEVETPNDISGVVYISHEIEWKLDLAKELRKSGYPVDMNKVV